MRFLEYFVLVLVLAGSWLGTAASWAANTEAQVVVGAESIDLEEPVPVAGLPRLDCLLDMTEHVNDILSGGRDEPIRYQLDALFLVGDGVAKGARFRTLSRVRILDEAGLTVDTIELEDRARKQGKKVPKRWYLDWDPRSAGLGEPLAEGRRAYFESYSRGLNQKLTDRASHFCNAR